MLITNNTTTISTESHDHTRNVDKFLSCGKGTFMIRIPIYMYVTIKYTYLMLFIILLLWYLFIF